MTIRWYAAATQTNAEDKAGFHLRSQGFEFLCPKYRRQRRHARRTETVLRPLFPGYIFVGFDPELAPWRSINGTVGVRRLVQTGDRPVPVPAGICETMIARQDDTGAINLDVRKFNPGDRLLIAEGAFAECYGLFESMIDEERVILLLDILGRSVRTEMRVSSLSAAV